MSHYRDTDDLKARREAVPGMALRRVA